MSIKNPWTYYYGCKDELQMLEAYFTFTGKDDLVYNDMEKIYEGLKRIGEHLAEVNRNGDN